MYPELFICDPPTTKQESSNYHNFLSEYNNKDEDAKKKLKDTRAEALKRSSVYVTYKNIVERQVEQLRAENKKKIKAEMTEITGKEKKLKENDFTIKYSDIERDNTKTYYEFKTKIKESKTEIDKFDEKIIKKKELSCSDKARYKNIITILKKSTLKLSKYVNKAKLTINLSDIIKQGQKQGQSKIVMDNNFIQSTNNDTNKNNYFRTTQHDDKPVTTQSTTQNYIGLKKQSEDSYINTFKDSYI